MTDFPEDEMLTGYRDGRADDRDDLPTSAANRSPAYCHGWRNGRDDRVGLPRAGASDLRAEAVSILTTMRKEMPT